MRPPDPLFRLAAVLARFGSRLRAVLRVPALRVTALRVPVIRQTTASDCGAACLCMALCGLGRAVALTDVRSLLGAGRDGIDAASLVRCADALGFEAEGIRIEPQDLRWISVPAILHWNFNHFVVLTYSSASRAVIIDPAIGRRTLPMAEVARSLTGVALVFRAAPTAAESCSRPRTLHRFAGVLRGAGGHVVRIIGLSGALQALGLSLPYWTAVAVDRLSVLRPVEGLPALSAGLAFLVCSYGLVAGLRELLLARLQVRLDEGLMAGFVAHMLSLPVSFFHVRAAGDLVHRLSSSSVVRDLLSRHLVSLCIDSLLLVGYLCVMLSLHIQLALLVLVLGSVYGFLLFLGNVLCAEPLRNELSARARHHGLLVEIVSGIETIKACAAEARVLEKWRDVFIGELEAGYRRAVRGALSAGLLGAFAFGFPLALLLAGVHVVRSGGLTLGEMLGFSALAGAFLAPLGGIGGQMNSLHVVRAHLTRLEEILEATPEMTVPQPIAPTRIEGGIDLRRVSFRYSPVSPMVLRDVSLRIERGQFVAIVGPSGSGKSTILRLIAGLLEPVDGEVLVDGHPHSAYRPRDLRSQLGIVFQRSTLFSDTIRANVLFANSGAPEEAVVRCIETAGLSEALRRMPMGLDTYVSENGGNVSGGERQRICIARALVASPRILLLDEATSEIDGPTERSILLGLAALECTKVVVAHRLSTVQGADLIVVIDRGRIVEQGRHEALLARGGMYATMAFSPVEGRVSQGAAFRATKPGSGSGPSGATVRFSRTDRGGLEGGAASVVGSSREDHDGRRSSGR